MTIEKRRLKIETLGSSQTFLEKLEVSEQIQTFAGCLKVLLLNIADFVTTKICTQQLKTQKLQQFCSLSGIFTL